MHAGRNDTRSMVKGRTTGAVRSRENAEGTGTAPSNHLRYFSGAVPAKAHSTCPVSLAGPANKPEGITALRAAVKTLPHNSEIVIYCGCCPMKDCPNIRPAYRALKEMGFNHLRVLNLPTNFHTDWAAKGYPVET
jgi:hypothetical protein